MNFLADLPPPPLRKRADPDFSDRLVVKSSGHILFLSLRSLHFVSAQGDYVKFHCDGQSALVRATMKDVARRLDPRRFLQIHRSTIVNVDRISRISFRDDRRLGVILRDGTALLVSQGCRQRVKDFYEAGMRPRPFRGPDVRPMIPEDFMAEAPAAELAASG